MENDICLCGEKKSDHVNYGEVLVSVLQSNEAIVVPTKACASFRIDRNATWRAERNRKSQHLVTLLTGCTVCGAKSATYHKTTHGQYRHSDCPGQQTNA